MRISPTPIADGEHTIGYAYPTSHAAVRLGFSSNGCHFVETADSAVAAGSYADAKMIALNLGTTPSRWSKDHPDNARFLPRNGGAS